MPICKTPPEVIPDLVKKWEQGAEVVTGVKNKSRENKIMFFFRTVFYFIMNFVFAMNLVPHATDFGLFDRCFIDTILNSNYRDPFLRGIIFDVVDKNKIAYIDYIQDRRNAGKTKFNVSKYYDFAVCGIVSFSRKLPRRFIAVGIAAVIFSFAELLFNFIPDCVRHTVTCISDSLIIRFIFLMSALLTILISIAFEYIISVQKKLDDKPFVSEEERIAY